eukprot:135563-Lingulodinium_polyedra.AAC.1
MAASDEDRLATGDLPADCAFPQHAGHPGCFSYKEWANSYGQKGLHCDWCGRWAGPEHIASRAPQQDEVA